MTVTISPITALLGKAKRIAVGKMPYLACMLSRSLTVETTKVKTMAVDEYGKLYINPEWVGKHLKKEEHCAFVLLHEMMHIALSHAKRRAAVAPTPNADQCKAWNVAADVAINEMLCRDVQAMRPPFGVFYKDVAHIDGMQRDLSTEAMYKLIYKEQQQQPEPQGGGQGQPEDDGEDDGEGDGNNEPLQSDDCGSSADGIPRPWEKQPTFADSASVEGKISEVMDEMDKHDRSAAGKGIGKVPAGLRRAVEHRVRPQPDPFQLLSKVCSTGVHSHQGSSRKTWARPNRRLNGDEDYALMGTIKYDPKVTVIIDTSASMEWGDAHGKAVTSVAQAIKRIGNPTIICCDAAIHSVKAISSLKDFDWVGGGGTDMAKAVIHADQHMAQDVIVVITDGGTGWPAKPTTARLIIGLVGNDGGSEPSWAYGVVDCNKQGSTYAA